MGNLACFGAVNIHFPLADGYPPPARCPVSDGRRSFCSRKRHRHGATRCDIPNWRPDIAPGGVSYRGSPNHVRCRDYGICSMISVKVHRPEHSVQAILLDNPLTSISQDRTIKEGRELTKQRNQTGRLPVTGQRWFVRRYDDHRSSNLHAKCQARTVASSPAIGLPGRRNCRELGVDRLLGIRRI
jgi:hypothetical protein